MTGDPSSTGIPVPATGGERPGDEAESGASQTAQNTCPACGGTGSLQSKPCPECEGTGMVTVTVGDA
jgi:DnaJ-class molecular chaperone